MKKVAMLFVFILAFVANTFAQTDAVAAPLTTEKMSKQDRKAKMKQHADELGLSAEQKTKMKEIGQSFKGKMKAIKSDAALTKDQKKVQAGEVAKQHEADVKALLSAEQFTKWQVKAKERRAKMKEFRGKKGGKKGDNDDDNR